MGRSCNLLEETIAVLGENGKTPADVLWVGDGKLAVSWSRFAKMIQGVVYDSGFGRAEICGGLLVVGNWWWLERKEYDGSERWDFKELPKLGHNARAFKFDDSEDGEGYSCIIPDKECDEIVSLEAEDDMI